MIAANVTCWEKGTIPKIEALMLPTLCVHSDLNAPTQSNWDAKDGAPTVWREMEIASVRMTGLGGVGEDKSVEEFVVF